MALLHGGNLFTQGTRDAKRIVYQVKVDVTEPIVFMVFWKDGHVLAGNEEGVQREHINSIGVGLWADQMQAMWNSNDKTVPGTNSVFRNKLVRNYHVRHPGQQRVALTLAFCWTE
eukprot:1486653-Rhodomonas_salina.1